jgi:hypothetical protein
MWGKIRFFLSFSPPIAVLVVMILSYNLNVKSYDLESKKLKIGQIPEKKLKIETYGVTNVSSLFKTFADIPISIFLAGKELKRLYSITYMTTFKTSFTDFMFKTSFTLVL